MPKPASAKVTASINHPFEVTFTREADGGYSASVTDLPGCYSEGDTLAEAKRNIREAIECHLEAMAILARRAAKSGAKPTKPAKSGAGASKVKAVP